MKRQNNSHMTPHWLDNLLVTFYSPRRSVTEKKVLPPDFEKRCRQAVLSALDILRMSHQRSKLVNIPGPLSEHCEGLARLAGVNLGGIRSTLRIGESPAQTISLNGMARFARDLGIPRNEAMERLELDLALHFHTPAKGALIAALRQPLAKQVSPGLDTLREVRRVLRQCEKQFGIRASATLDIASRAILRAYEAGD